MMKENRYGAPIREISFYLSYLIPNLYDFGIDIPAMTNFGREYLYLGAPALFGIAVFLRYPRWRPAMPLLACGAVCLIFLTDPFHAISMTVAKIPILAEVCGAWYFLAGLTVTAAGVAAFGIDQFLTAAAKPFARIWTVAAIISTAAWATYELHLWSASAFRPGAWSALDALATLLVFTLCISSLRGRSKAMTAVLLLCAAIDYKSFGTSKRFNARKGSLPHGIARWTVSLPRTSSLAFQASAAHPEYRILLDPSAPMPAELRHHALSSPQGFDPFVAQRYLNFVKKPGSPRRYGSRVRLRPQQSTRTRCASRPLCNHNPQRPELFRHLEANPAFKLLETRRLLFSRLRISKLLTAVHRPRDLARRGLRKPAELAKQPHRTDTEFVLKEQFFPGWTAKLDGTPIPIQLWRGAFQSVQIPAGNHKLDLHYESQALKIGAWVSATLSVLLLGAISLRRMAFRRRRSGNNLRPATFCETSRSPSCSCIAVKIDPDHSYRYAAEAPPEADRSIQHRPVQPPASIPESNRSHPSVQSYQSPPVPLAALTIKPPEQPYFPLLDHAEQSRFGRNCRSAPELRVSFDPFFSTISA